MNLTEVKIENGVLQEEVRAMRAQLDAYSVASYIPRDRGRSVAAASHSHFLNSSPSLSRSKTSMTSSKDVSWQQMRGAGVIFQANFELSQSSVSRTEKLASVAINYI